MHASKLKQFFHFSLGCVTSLSLLLEVGETANALNIILPTGNQYRNSIAYTLSGNQVSVSSRVVSDDFVEIDGLRFQVFLSNQEIGEKDSLTFQDYIFSVSNNSGSYEDSENWTRFYLALRVTNTTNKPIYFSRFGHVELSIVDADGRAVSQLEEDIRPMSYGSIPANPGESINFVLPGWLSRNNSQIAISFAGCSSCPISFRNMKLGKYQLKLTYSNHQDEVNGPDIDPRQFSTPDNPILRSSSQTSEVKRIVWKGEVTPPPVKLHLVP
jgi:hypothetical protein